jgi:mRNA interferase MazF
MAKGPRITHPRRGEVYLTSFDPTTGAEIKKTRPALILQNDIANQHSPITVVAAITSKFDDPLIRPKFLSGPVRLDFRMIPWCFAIRSPPLIGGGW